ncbi:MAG: transglutaminase-like [Solirubrobacterales bacterium]|jgi:transglutaminase-like putative cysteine protease|nr:transglutaminase-like [Solirubrobacterales bacterium]
MHEYLEPGRSIDADHPDVVAFARDRTAGIEDPREQAIALNLAVRDEIRYDPYGIDQSPEGFRASSVLARGSSYCIPKAALLAAAARVLGIPSRVGYADVRNHLTTPKLRAVMGTDVFLYHGYTELHLDGRWVKATPAFNRSLCERANIAVLDFDGIHDSIVQPLDLAGRRHMEYLVDHGTFADVPIAQIQASWRAHYPYMGEGLARVSEDADAFERDARAPTA